MAAGKGLGARQQGITEPVTGAQQQQRTGLGYGMGPSSENSKAIQPDTVMLSMGEALSAAEIRSWSTSFQASLLQHDHYLANYWSLCRCQFKSWLPRLSK